MASNLRIPGINTGMDTQATIDQIMKYTRVPLDRLKQKQQTLIWKQEAYRVQNTALSKLKDLLFDLKLQKTYNIKSVMTSNSQIVTATANPAAVNGSYSVRVQQMATVAKNVSSNSVSIRSQIMGNQLDVATTPITIGPGNNQINVTVDGVTKTITLTNKVYNGEDEQTLADLAADIQNQINSSGFGTTIYVKANADDQLVFYTAQKDNTAPYTISLSTVGADSTLTGLGFSDNANTKELTGNILSNPIAINSSSNKFKITVGNQPTREITLSEGSYDPADPDQLEAFRSDVESKIRSLGGVYDNIRVSVTSFKQLKIEYLDASAPQSIKLESGSTADVLEQMCFSNGTMSEAKNALSTTLSFWNQKDKFINSSFFDGKDENTQFKFVINGKEFTFSCKNTLTDVIDAVKAAGVNVHYEASTDKLVFTTTQTGDNNPSGYEMLISDPDGFLGTVFNLSQAGEEGGDNAVVFVNNIEMQSQSNTVTYNGITFTLNGETGTQATTVINVATDTSGIIARVKEFVDKYNEIIASMNSQVTQKRASSGDKYNYYLPLTDTQKKEMSADEIKAWEEKAKQGILFSDDILAGVLSEMRTGLYRQVDTPRTLSGLRLSDSGIDLTGAHRFSITVGGNTQEISLTERSYTVDQYNELVRDIQNKLDAAFGSGRVKVNLSGSNGLTFSTQNQTMTLNSASQFNGLEKLGFVNGVNVKATYNNVSQIGITTGSYYENGKLYLNTEMLEQALQDDPEGVMRLLTNNETIAPLDFTPTEIAKAKMQEKQRQGIFFSLYDVLNSQVAKISNQAGSSGTASGGNVLGQQLIDLGDQIDRTQDRISAEEERLWSIFSRMEVMIGQMDAQMGFITSMLNQSKSR